MVGVVVLSQARLILLFQSKKRRSWAPMMMSRKTPMITARVRPSPLYTQVVADLFIYRFVCE